MVVTGFGLSTSLGPSFWHTALALRKKRSNYREHEDVLVADIPSGSILRGAIISRLSLRLVPTNLQGVQRAAALLAPAVQECLADVSSVLKRKTGWKIVNHCAPGEEGLLDLLGEKAPECNFPEEASCRPQPTRCDFFTQIGLAAEELLANRAEAVVVACVDSLCTRKRLTELLYSGLLKDAANPHGIMAAEAAGAVFLERESAARRRGAAILAGVASWGAATEPHPWTGASASTAQGLTTAFHQAFGRLDDLGASVSLLITDENGERPRALEWALAEGRIFPNPDRERRLRHPAVTAGDSGGALGAVLLADALAHLAWHRHSMRRVALATSDDHGERGVLCLEPGDRCDRRTLMADIRRRLSRENGYPENR
ncbi:3-oxoacyl-ACP synthase [Geobacter sp.]|uniref:3-oxoacyl-ACP synthase n=1 Tax=Geobacter sp. TaxID=46610 RepID=UPI00262EDD47|nr:3-oxoacyl-ACP synthase [Geobacter sp.]